MSPKLASHISRRDFLRFGGTAALGVAAAGSSLVAPAPADAQEITYPYKTWQISGQDAYILADEATQTYYQYTTGGPRVRLSKNLLDWSDSFSIWTRPPAGERWYSTQAPWACEVHKYNGKYYLFATFHNNATRIATAQAVDTPDPYAVWQNQTARATIIFVADSPMGPFVGLHDDRPVTDPRFMTLDGTLHVAKDGTPYMVYAHEWVQKMDGTMEGIQLTPDLTGAVGEPFLLFNGSEGLWYSHPVYGARPGQTMVNDDQQPIGIVTDGPEFYWTPNGSLITLWTSYRMFDSYTQAAAISRSGDVHGPWEQLPSFLNGGRGHGMIFKTFEGQDMMVVMKHNAPVGGGSRMEFYEVEITDDGIKLLSHREDLDGQPGMDLEDTTPPDLHVPANRVVNATSPDGAVVTYTTMAYDWRDGSVPVNSSHASGSTFAIGHTSVTCWAEDAAHNTATATFDVHVKGAAEQIADQIALVALARPKGKSFTSQLESALASLADGKNTAACNQLNAFINHVRAQSGKQLSVALANKLIANATRIIAVIGG